MKIFYISPSVMPSRSANSIHVANMCEALTQLGHNVVLFVGSEDSNVNACQDAMLKFYGIDNEKIQVVPYFIKHVRGVEIYIALYSLFYFIKSIFNQSVPRFIIARNLYAALFFGVICRRNIIYETHSPEKGIRKVFQKWLVNCKKARTIVISEALKDIISSYFNILGESIYVFHDAARADQKPLNTLEKKAVQKSILGDELKIIDFKKIVGYFGHLYSGRGIDIIEGLAGLNGQHAFVVYGGHEKDIARLKQKNSHSNLFFMGHISPEKVSIAMAMMDVLLMPYQKSVSVGLAGVDTAQWMSPMKMFEYMSVGVPIISSDLPVLKEVLVHNKNALLVKPNNVDEWSRALQQIDESPELEEKLGQTAYKQYAEKYTWKIRAKGILNLLIFPKAD
ncbi:MAG: glycosyltransferase involved in cell wall biosynthesis [Psychroserpens sp.]|jgi:glycosyltransferase involved in cell wall biosynthesis